MGVCNTGLKLLLSNNSYLDFSTSCSIGRQELRASEIFLKLICDSKNIILENYKISYLDELINNFACNKFDSIDYSNFEGSNIIHDMNKAISSDLYFKYSFVFDGGTLEHIFNVTEAIKNSMLLVKPGGHYIGVHPCNNQSGHGFYQFSPEFYFRVFNEENGFIIKKAFVYKAKVNNKCVQEISDPSSVNSRVSLISLCPLNLFIIAERVNEIVPFKTFPIQSDYELLWNNNSKKRNKSIDFNLSWIFNFILNKIKKYFPIYVNPQVASKIKKI